MEGPNLRDAKTADKSARDNERLAGVKHDAVELAESLSIQELEEEVERAADKLEEVGKKWASSAERSISQRYGSAAGVGSLTRNAEELQVRYSALHEVLEKRKGVK